MGGEVAADGVGGGGEGAVDERGVVLVGIRDDVGEPAKQRQEEHNRSRKGRQKEKG